MEIRVRAKVEGFSIWMDPEELASPRDAARQFEQLVQEASSQISIESTRGSSSLITLASGSSHLQLPAPADKAPLSRQRPLVQCPHCEEMAHKGAGLAAHIRREHNFLRGSGG